MTRFVNTSLIISLTSHLNYISQSSLLAQFLNNTPLWSKYYLIVLSFFRIYDSMTNIDESALPQRSSRNLKREYFNWNH